tara:strand:+ start:53 stop:229 length:177 start_codon:yes stop_codon:yes gene_type:complete
MQTTIRQDIYVCQEKSIDGLSCSHFASQPLGGDGSCIALFDLLPSFLGVSLGFFLPFF